MTLFVRGIRSAAGALALFLALPACAQENLDHGKSAVQLFAKDCALCHKSPQTLGKAGGIFGLESFLRQHYTASRESAAALAKYLQAVAAATPEPARPQRVRRPATGSDQAKKPAEKKPSDAKSSDAKSSDAKSSDAKPSDAKPSEAKPLEDKPAEAKPVEAKPVDVKPAAEVKPAESKPPEAKAEAKSEVKPEPKPEPKAEAKPAAAKPE